MKLNEATMVAVTVVIQFMGNGLRSLFKIVLKRESLSGIPKSVKLTKVKQKYLYYYLIYKYFSSFLACLVLLAIRVPSPEGRIEAQ